MQSHTTNIMKITVNQSVLNSHLSLVSRVVPPRPSHPVLSNILLTAKDGEVTLTGFDLSMSIQTSFEAIVDEPGSITIPAKLFGEIVGKLPNKAEITVTIDGTNITVSTPSGQYKLRGIQESEYPMPPIVAGGEPIVIPSDLLASAIKATCFACSSEESKQILCGVNLQSIPDGIAFAATEGHRLSVMNIESQQTDLNLVLPTKAVKELERLSGDEDVSLYVDHGLTLFKWGSQSLTTRTIDGTYPNYPQLIPQQFERMVTANRKELIASLDRIAVLADQKNNVVRMTLNPNEQAIVLSVDTADLGSGRETISAQVSGEELLLSFNVKYLGEGLRSIVSEEINIHLNGATSPVVLRPVNSTNQLYLLMPVQIRA